MRQPRAGSSRARTRRERGSLAIGMLLMLFVVVAAAGALAHLALLLQGSTAREQASAQALCLAESGVEVAVHCLASGAVYAGESATPLGPGRFSVAVHSRAPVEVVATGEVTYAGVLTQQRTVRVRGTLSGGRFRQSEWRELPPSAHLAAGAAGDGDGSADGAVSGVPPAAETPADPEGDA